jgi:hypothetical protein
LGQNKYFGVTSQVLVKEVQYKPALVLHVVEPHVHLTLFGADPSVMEQGAT